MNGGGLVEENLSYSHGDVGIGTNQPTANFSIIHGGGLLSQLALDVTIASNTKFQVSANGGTSIGSGETPPVNGLNVFGNTQIGGGTLIGTGESPPTNGLVVLGNTRLGPSFISGNNVSLDINSNANGATDGPFRVRKNETIKFYVDAYSFSMTFY